MEQEPLPPSAQHNLRPPPPVAFYWGKEARFLFLGWPHNNSGRYTVALIFVFILASLVEILSDLHFLVRQGKNRFWAETTQAGTHAVQAGFSYNGGIFVTAVSGHAVVYVIF